MFTYLLTYFKLAIEHSTQTLDSSAVVAAVVVVVVF